METPVQQPFLFQLRTKITGLVLLVVLLMGTISYYNISLDFQARQSEMENGMMQIVNAAAQKSRSQEERADWTVYQEYIDNIYQAFESIVYIAVVDQNGSIPAYILNEDKVEIQSETAVTDSLMKHYVLMLISGGINESVKFYLLKPFFYISVDMIGNVSDEIRFGESVLGTVHVGYDRIELYNDLVPLYNRNIIMLASFIVIGFLASLLLSRRITKPLARLSAAMETVPHGNMDTIALKQSSDEIGSLAQSFNFMVKELREKDFFDRFERDLGKVFTLEKIFITLLGRLDSLYGINKGALFIKQKQTHEYYEIYQHNFAAGFPGDFHATLERSLENHLMRGEICFSLEGLKIISHDIPSLRPALSIAEENHIHWTVFLVRQNTCIGVIYLGKNIQDFTIDIEEKKYIVNLVRHALLPFEVALLHADLTEQERLKRELEISRTVQSNLLPQQKPKLRGYDIYGVCIPAKEVGGDYFDYVEIGKDKLGIVIADVAGKSASAAFYMAEIKGMIVSLSGFYNSPRELLKVLNSRMFVNVDRKVFASMIYGVLNTRSNEFTFSRAGHNPLLVKYASKDLAEYYTPDGIGLGLDRGEIFDAIITEKKIKLKKGDTLLLYTDGVVETMNKDYIDFGEERLRNIILRQDTFSSEFGCRQILNEIEAYSSGCEQFDDITMVMIKRSAYWRK